MTVGIPSPCPPGDKKRKKPSEQTEEKPEEKQVEQKSKVNSNFNFDFEKQFRKISFRKINLFDMCQKENWYIRMFDLL